MSSLSNYLQTNRKRLTLSQEEAAFLLGFKGTGKGSKVSRHESFISEPLLRTALAYEVIYQKPIRELFAGLYDETEREVAERAKILNFRRDWKPNKRTDYKRQVLTGLAARQAKPALNPSQP
jgi:hypothetical protein